VDFENLSQGGWVNKNCGFVHFFYIRTLYKIQLTNAAPNIKRRTESQVILVLAIYEGTDGESPG
jgi:hypothetical protein